MTAPRLHLPDPGVVPCNFWRPDDFEVGSSEPCSAHCAVGLKV